MIGTVGSRACLAATAAMAGLWAGVAHAQSAAAEAPTPALVSSAMPILSTARWTVADARELLAEISASGREGLRPIDYRPAALERAIDAGDADALAPVAQAAAAMLAHDYLLGRVGGRESLDWYIRPGADELTALPAQLAAALAEHRVGAFLRGLLPADARYAALRDALATAESPAERDAIRANMERWRWMPRALGDSYLYVNVPSYRLEVIADGAASATYTVVVGAPDTPTPQLASDTSSLVVNPWWNVPASIVKKAQLRPGRAGYVFKAAAGGWQVRQPPGPRNSLGRIKFNLVNDQAIYLHDTPAKALFARDQRALSHGCIRVKNIAALASALMAEGDEGQLQEALAQRDTQTLRLPRSWPVYLVYFTLDLGPDGKLVRYGDPYARDPAVLAGLDGGTIQVAAN